MKKFSNLESRISNARADAPAACSQLSTLNSQPPRPRELARALAKRHGVDFDKDLRDYEWPNGVIVDLPNCFAIAYVTKTATGELAWFVKTAVGDLAQLLLLFPIELPYIAFHRERGGKRMRIYRTDMVLRMARKVRSLNRKSQIANRKLPAFAT